MLFINGEKSSADEVLDVINRATGSKLARKSLSILFKKNNEFELNPVIQMVDLGASRKTGMKVMKQPKGADVLARFKFHSREDGIDYEIRYTDVMPHYNEATKSTVYRPKSIDLRGPYHMVPSADGSNFEKALFIYLHPKSYNSPLHKMGSVYKYSHVNPDEEFEKRAQVNSDLMDCLRHLDSLNNVDLVVFAKSLRIDISDRKGSQVKTLLQDFLLSGANNVKKYKGHMDDQSEIFIGRIIDAVDNGYIVPKKNGNSTVWSYNLKNNQNQIVVAPPQSKAKEVLIDHIKANISEHFPVIHSMTKEVLDGQEYKQYFESLESGDGATKELRPEAGIMEIDQIVDFASAKAFYQYYFKVPTSFPATVSKFFKDVEAGVITSENWEEHEHKFKPKSKANK